MTDAAEATEPVSPSEPDDSQASTEPARADFDADRRQFFRRFAGEILTGAGQVVGVVSDLRDRSAAEASALLGQSTTVPAGSSSPAPAWPVPGGVASAAHVSPAAETSPPEGAAPSGFRTPFRFESDDVLLVIDQRRLPDALVETR